MPTKKLLSISEFAKITQTTRRTLIFMIKKISLNQLKSLKMAIAITVMGSFIRSDLFWVCVI